MNEHISSAQSPEQNAPGTRADSQVAGADSVPASSQTPAQSSRERPAWPWWDTAWATRLALVAIVLLGAYFRFLGLTDWDSGTAQHPDERFFSDVTTSVRLPASLSDYFDSARSPANPRNVGKTFFVYGTFPVLLTRFVAVMLTPDEALPETVPRTSGNADGTGTDGTETPSIVPNPERAVPKLPLLQAWLNPEGRNLTGEVQRVGRVLVALFDLASILMVFLIGARLYDRRAGLLAALLSALAVMSIQQSHFFVDPIFSTFFTLLALYWAVRVAQGGGVWSYAALGVSIGFAMANRITLAALGVVAIVAAVQAALVWHQQARDAEARGETPGLFSRSFIDLFLNRSLPLLFLAGFLTLLTFRVVQPYAFTGSLPDSPPIWHDDEAFGWMRGLGFFDVRPSPRFLDNMAEVKRLVSGEADFYPSQQWVGRTAYLFPWKNMVIWGMGPALGIIVWSGWVVAGWLLLRRVLDAARGTAPARALAPLVLWVWVGLYFAWQGGQFASTMRYMLPIYGALIVFGAWLLLRLWDWSRRAGDGAYQAARGRWWGRIAVLLPPPAVLRWLPVLVVLATLGWSYAFSRIYTRPHSRVMAAEWLAQHAPPGSRITFEDWDDPLPLQVIGWNPWGVTYKGIKTFTYAEEEPSKYFGSSGDPGLLNELEEADYITLTSNRVYASTSRMRMRYPVLMRYYHHLFNGNLGFELVADVTSYPTLLGIPIPDQGAEEAFTVYDHPRVLIFKKTPRFSRERAEALITNRANWNEVYKLPVALADRNPTALRITESDWPLYRHSGTWSALYDPQSFVNSDIFAPFVWLLTLELIGLAAFALLFRLLPWLPDRGLSLARALGLLLVAYIAWLLGSLHLLYFNSLTLWLCALPLLAGGAWGAWRSRAELRLFWQERRNAILSTQALYLGLFLLMLLIRWLNPDLWHPGRGGEKPMDFAYLNAVLQSGVFPPYDPWFAGGYINYYYFGFVIVGALIHLTSIIPSVAYNLTVPTLFALTALGAWGAVYNLLAPRSGGPTVRRSDSRAVRQSGSPASDGEAEKAAEGEDNASVSGTSRFWRVEGRARLSALLAPLFVVLVGSLTQAIWFVSGYAADNQHRPEWAFWDATRIISGTVNEFPFFTFLFADLHAHMIVMPFSLALVGLLVALVRMRRQQHGWHTPTFFQLPVYFYLLLGLLAGTLRATNTWDYPTFVGLTAATLALLAWRQYWRERHTLRAETGLHPAMTAARRLLILLVQIALVVGVGSLLFLPFTSYFATESTGVELLREGLSEGWLRQVIDAKRTTLWDILRIYGLWLFLLVSAGGALASRSMRLPVFRRGHTQRSSTVYPTSQQAERYDTLLFIVGTLAGLLIAGVWWFTTRVETPGPESVSADTTVSSPWLLAPLLAGTVWLAWQMRRRPPRALLPLLWGGTALALCLGVEFFVVRGDVGRMNTVFKFGLHAWILFALASAVALPWVWRQVGEGIGWAWRGAAVLLVAATLVYPLTATPARIGDRYAADLPYTLDGAQFMRYVSASEEGQNFPLNDDYQAIAWIQDHIQGTPIMLEAHLPSYRWAGRIATHTGLPTLLGWEWHQIQQRNAVQGGLIVTNRQHVVEQIYAGQDDAQALNLLRLYGIEYVYVGGLERALYGSGTQKFDRLTAEGALNMVYLQGETTIYQVPDPDTPTVLSNDLNVQPPTRNTPPPMMLEEPVSQLPVVNEYAWNTWASTNPWSALLVWLVVLYALLLLGLPVAVLLFGRWRDGGVVWARLIGLLLLGYAVWLPTSLKLWHYDLWSVAGGVLMVLMLNLAVLARLGRGSEDAEPGAENSEPGSEDAEPGAENSEPAGESQGRLTAFAGALRRGPGVIGSCLREHWRGILMSEGLFLAAFLLFTWVRALNPDLWHPEWGGEKPMESGFLNAILRSAVMPPYDPFFSGAYINYYYYGLYLVSLPIKATGIAPALAYNLVVPTIFALTLTGAYAIVARLTGHMRYGLMGAAFLALLGNLATVVPAGWSTGIAPVLAALRSGSLADLGERLGDWYIGPSRVIPYTINEFPFWTFLYADLHPHMTALPVVLLTIALAYQYATRSDVQPAPPIATTSSMPLHLLTALALGTLAVTNSWDFPTYVLLVGAALAGAAWRSARYGIPWAAMTKALLLAGGLALGGMVLYTPFFDHFHAMVSGIGLVREGSYIGEYFLLYGLFLAVLLPVLLGTLWRLLRLESLKYREVTGAKYTPLVVCVLLPLPLVLLAWWQPVAGLAAMLGALLALGLFIYFQRRLNTALWFALLLALVAWAVSLGIEVVFVRDHLVDTNYYRMNTMFKFGGQIWILLALAAAVSLPALLRGLGRFGQRVKIGPLPAQAVGLVMLAVLVAAAAVFPVAGTLNRIAHRFPVSTGPTLDGLAFLREARFTYDCEFSGYCQPGDTLLEIDLGPDAEAIAWLKDNLVGTPVVVQSGLWFYRAYGVRVAANTGFPTVSSELHANEQHDPTLVAIRNRDVRTLFTTTDIETTLRLLAEYHVDYIYVGPIERAFYPAAGLQKFADMTDTYLDTVYEAPGASIYQVGHIPPFYAQPEPFTFVEEEPRPREPPPLRDTTGQDDLLTPDDLPASSDTPAPEPPGDVPPELRELEERVAANPSDGSLAYGLAERYRELDRLQEAIRVLEFAAQADPTDVGLHHLLGDILVQAERRREARLVYRTIAEEVPTAGNWNKLATNLIQWGELEQAEMALLRAIELDESEPEPHFRLGEVYYYQGKREQAIAELERYLALAPDGHFEVEARRFLDGLRQ